MNFLRKLTRKKNRNVNESKSDDVFDLKKLERMEEMLIKQQETLQKLSTQELEAARARSTTNKEDSIESLKRNKQLEAHIEKIADQIRYLQYHKNALKPSYEDIEIFNAQDVADQEGEMKTKMNIDKLRKLMEDVEKQELLAEELSKIVEARGKIEPELTTINDEDLEAEFEALEKEELGKEIEKMAQSLDSSSSKVIQGSISTSVNLINLEDSRTPSSVSNDVVLQKENVNIAEEALGQPTLLD